MSEAMWCNKSDHAFNRDAGFESLSGTKRIPNGDGTYKVIQITGDACGPCSEGAPLFAPPTDTKAITQADSTPHDAVIVDTEYNIIVDGEGDTWFRTKPGTDEWNGDDGNDNSGNLTEKQIRDRYGIKAKATADK